MIYLPLATDIAADRSREATRHARATLLREAAAGHLADPRPPRRGRRLIARPVRALSDASHALSELACTTAARIEGAPR